MFGEHDDDETPTPDAASDPVDDAKEDDECPPEVNDEEGDPEPEPVPCPEEKEGGEEEEEKKEDKEVVCDDSDIDLDAIAASCGLRNGCDDYFESRRPTKNSKNYYNDCDDAVDNLYDDFN
jgi:hypothetical protein